MNFLFLSLFLMISSCSPEKPSSSEIQMDESLDRGIAVSKNAKTRSRSNRLSKSSVSDLNSQESSIESKQIKNGQLSLKVESINGKDKKIESILKQHDAYSTNSGTHGSHLRRNMTMTIRVHAEKFDQLMMDLEKIGQYTDSKSVSIRDVTEQFIDIQARLKNQKATEEQYLKILKKATNVRDILNVQNQLQQIRSQIESQEGRLKYLNSQVDYSTINLNLYEILENEIEPQSGFFSRVMQSLVRGWSNLISGFIWLIGLWPFVIIILMAVLFVKMRK